jgi:ribosome biogenesis GTPase
MKLESLGLNQQLVDQFPDYASEEHNLARVIQEHKERYIVQNAEGIFWAEITGNLRFAAESREGFPAVGDWVAINVFEGESAIVYRIMPRFSVMERQAVGAKGEKQMIAANLDFAMIVQSVDRDFNLNRLERYVVLARNGHIKPIVILNKADLLNAEQVEPMRMSVRQRLGIEQVYITSALHGEGLAKLHTVLEAAKTYCLIGSSGVGKSSIINYLLDDRVLAVNDISEATNKGKHTTTQRQLMILNSGAILIDTPGMREVGMTAEDHGIGRTFERITILAESCRFTDCTHTDEPGCQVRGAVENGQLSEEELENYLKLEKQRQHFSTTIAQKRRRDKSFGKMYKEVLKRNTKYNT